MSAPEVSRVPAARVAPGGRPSIAGGSIEADDEPEARIDNPRQLEVGIVAVVCAALTVAMGIYPGPLFDVARDAGAALVNLL